VKKSLKMVIHLNLNADVQFGDDDFFELLGKKINIMKMIFYEHLILKKL
jgi:hypothetical protein